MTRVKRPNRLDAWTPNESSFWPGAGMSEGLITASSVVEGTGIAIEFVVLMTKESRPVAPDFFLAGRFNCPEADLTLHST